MKILMTAIALTAAFCIMSHSGWYTNRSDAKGVQPSALAVTPVKSETTQSNAAKSPHRIDHIVIVVEENHSSKKISGNSSTAA